jgi:coatomer subunit zeta
VILCEGEVVVYRAGADCKFFLSSTTDENELILASVLDAVFDTLSLLFHGQMDHRTILDNLELVLLTIDEVLDHGHIMEMDPIAVQNRVIMRSSAPAGNGSNAGAEYQAGGGQPIGDLSISQALNLAKDQFQGFMANQRNLDGY